MSICLDCGFPSDDCICSGPSGADDALCSGWEVVCPDGVKRHYPYHNLGDAKSHARLASDPTRFANRGCRLAPKPSKLELALPKCPGGRHEVKPILMEPHRSTGQA